MLSAEDRGLPAIEQLVILARFAKSQMTDNQHDQIKKSCSHQIPISPAFFAALAKQVQDNHDYATVALGEYLATEYFTIDIPAIYSEELSLAKQAQGVKTWLADPANQDQIARVTEIRLGMRDLKVLPDLTPFVGLRCLSATMSTLVVVNIANLPLLQTLDFTTNYHLRTFCLSNLPSLQVLDIRSSRVAEYVFSNLPDDTTILE